MPVETTARITDKKTFTAEVRQLHPTECKTVEVDNPTYAERVQHYARAKKVVVDPIIGELIPGVEVAVSEPLLAVRSPDETRQAINVRLDGLGSAQLEIQQ